jgi:hypothetical protein
MTNGEKVWIEKDGKELASLEPNLEDEGGGPAPIGGKIICRNISGAPVIQLHGGGEHGSPFGYITILDGGFSIFRGVNSRARVNIHSGDAYAGEDGGTIELNNPKDSSSGGGPAIYLNASKRSIVINTPDGLPIVTLDRNGNLYLGGHGTDGDIVLIDGSGKDRILLDAHSGNLQILKPSGEPVVNLGKYGNLTLGGGKSGGDVILYNADGKRRVTLGADGMKLIIMNDSENLIEIGGTNGSLRTKGSLTTEGSFKHQVITERNIKPSMNKHYDLFSTNQIGSFDINLHVRYTYNTKDVNEPEFASGFVSTAWDVQTYDRHIQPEIIKYGDDQGWGQELPTLSEVNNKMRLTIGSLWLISDNNPQTPEMKAFVRWNGVLKVTAWFGSLLDF